MASDTSSRTPRRWADEDTTPTTTQELRGWYSYGVAAEVFAIVGVGSFLPVTLEQLARETGVLYSDRSTPCVAATAQQPHLLLMARAAAADSTTRDPDQCVITLFGAQLTTASFAMYTFSLAVFCQALTLVTLGSFADYGDNRKRLLLTFAFIGALSAMSWMVVVPSVYLLGPILAIVGVVCLGSSFVVQNSFLPLLAANHPQVREEEIKLRDVDPDHSPGIGSTSTVKGSPELRVSNQISTTGVGVGLIAAFFAQILSILILWIMSKVSSGPGASRTLPLRLILLLAGIWWLAFTTPTVLWLRKRPGPPLPVISHHSGRFYSFLSYVKFAWMSVWRTASLALQLRQAAKFLFAWFILSDAVATVSGTAILFARTELKFGTVQVALLSLTTSVSGIFGAWIWPIVSRRYGWSTNRTIVVILMFMEIVPLYGLMGYLPFIQRWGVGGLQQKWELFPLAFCFGAVMGGISSYCRSFYGLLVPPGSEVAFYALFAITDKGSSAIGPAVVGRIMDKTGQIRPVFIFLAILIALPMPVIWHIDADRGQADAKAMADRLKGLRRNDLDLQDLQHEEAAGLMNDSD